MKTLGEVVGSVAGSRKELGGDEGGLIGRAGDGWRLVVGDAGSAAGLGRNGWLEIAVGWTMGSMTCDG